jgi:hypothetical protein
VLLAPPKGVPPITSVSPEIPATFSDKDEEFGGANSFANCDHSPGDASITIPDVECWRFAPTLKLAGGVWATQIEAGMQVSKTIKSGSTAKLRNRICTLLRAEPHWQYVGDEKSNILPNK